MAELVAETEAFRGQIGSEPCDMGVPRWTPESGNVSAAWATSKARLMPIRTLVCQCHCDIAYPQVATGSKRPTQEVQK